MAQPPILTSTTKKFRAPPGVSCTTPVITHVGVPGTIRLVDGVGNSTLIAVPNAALRVYVAMRMTSPLRRRDALNPAPERIEFFATDEFDSQGFRIYRQYGYGRPAVRECV